MPVFGNAGRLALGGLECGLPVRVRRLTALAPV